MSLVHLVCYFYQLSETGYCVVYIVGKVRLVTTSVLVGKRAASILYRQLLGINSTQLYLNLLFTEEKAVKQQATDLAKKSACLPEQQGVKGNHKQGSFLTPPPHFFP